MAIVVDTRNLPQPWIASYTLLLVGPANAPTRRMTGSIAVTIIMVMAKKQPFALVYADEVKLHLRAIEPKYYPGIQSEIEVQLLHEPDVETRNRKPLKRPVSFGADSELASARITVSACSTRSTPRAVTPRLGGRGQRAEPAPHWGRGDSRMKSHRSPM